MELDFPNSISLLRSATDKELYQKLILQLNKDFALANVAMEVPLNTNPEELVDLLREKIYQLIMEQFSEYLSLLYVVDIPESEFDKLDVTDAVEMANQVSFILLKRIWKKVWFRANLS